MNCIAGFALLAGSLVLGATSLDQKAKDFEDAVTSAPPSTSAPLASANIAPLGRSFTVDDLQTMLKRNDNPAAIEMIAARLMATHDGAAVQKSGLAFLQALDAQTREKAQAYIANLEAAFADVGPSIHLAKKATDLDLVIRRLQELQTPPAGFPAFDTTYPTFETRVATNLQFLIQWQNYIAALDSGNSQQARNILDGLLNNRQPGDFILTPRSGILALRDQIGNSSSDPNASHNDAPIDIDSILAHIQKADDVPGAIHQLQAVPTPGWDWSGLIKLDRARDDLRAGLPSTLDLKPVLDDGPYGSDLSRIVALELLDILPLYFGTETSEPPRPGEQVSAYLDRLAADADQAGNLALLQRVLTIKVALGTVRDPSLASGTPIFLAGLTQEAAGQFAPAVVSYENALKNPDPFLPVKIAGQRLASIKAAHSADYQSGLDSFMTPAATPFDPHFPPFFHSGLQPSISVLPIPMPFPLPARSPAPISPPSGSSLPPAPTITPNPTQTAPAITPAPPSAPD